MNISPTPSPSPADSPQPEDAAPLSAGILGQRWPMLGRAIGRYEQRTAETFTRMAYDAVEAGLIRHEERDRLAKAAEEMGIRAFDAQLLIACAVRQWALDRRYDPTPSPVAPALSFEYQSWRRLWTRIALVILTAITLDAIILWKWLH